MEDDPHSDEEILEILKMKKVAVVGMSKNPDKAAHYVPKYLQDSPCYNQSYQNEVQRFLLPFLML